MDDNSLKMSFCTEFLPRGSLHALNLPPSAASKANIFPHQPPVHKPPHKKRRPCPACAPLNYILLRTFPNIRVLSLHLPSDHNDHSRQHDSHNDRGNRALDAKSHIVEKAVGRRSCIQPEDRVREYISTVGQPRQNALGEVPAGIAAVTAL